ncbi:UNVERIFIED_CONTAM: hypothetical protein RKD50_006247 [Streptomyces canus]
MPRFSWLQQPRQFGDLFRVPVRQPARVPGPARVADPLYPGAALFREVDEPGPAVRRVGCAGDEAQVLQGAQLAGHRGLADADVGGQFGGTLAAAFIQTDEQAVSRRLQVGVDLAGHLALVGPGPAQQDGQLAFQREESGLVHTARRHVGPAPAPAAVSVFVHVSPCLECPGR